MEPEAPEEARNGGTPELERFFTSLRDLEGGVATLDALADQASRVPGIGRIDRLQDCLDVHLAVDVTAEQCARWLLLHDAFIVSGDVHQALWSVAVKIADVPDPFGTMIHCDSPVVGRWEVRVWTDGRPPGPLPDIRAGAAPAYPIEESDVRVRKVRFRLAAAE